MLYLGTYIRLFTFPDYCAGVFGLTLKNTACVSLIVLVLGNLTDKCSDFILIFYYTRILFPFYFNLIPQFSWVVNDFF